MNDSLKEFLNDGMVQPNVKNVTISVEKSLGQWKADNPRQHYSQTKELFTSKEAVVNKLSDPFKKAIPIMLIFGAVMIIALIMGNMPTVISSIGNTFGVEKHIVTETVQKVEIVYLTPEEAAEQGIAVPQIVPDDAPAPQIQVNEIPEGTDVSAEDSANPRLEGFDVAGNLLPSVPIKLGEETVNVGTNGTSP
jgi:hypothetical protein